MASEPLYVADVPEADIGGLMTPGEGSPRKRAVAFVASTSLCYVAPFLPSPSSSPERP